LKNREALSLNLKILERRPAAKMRDPLPFLPIPIDFPVMIKKRELLPTREFFALGQSSMSNVVWSFSLCL